MWQEEPKCPLLTFYTFRFFRCSFWKKEALTGAEFIGFSVNEFCSQTPLVTDFYWWKGNVVEFLSLKKEITNEGQETRV